MPSRSHLNASDIFRDTSIVTLTLPGDSSERSGEMDLRGLLELACDWYWTLDDDHRLVRLDGRQLDDRHNAMQSQLGRRPWEWAGVLRDHPGLVRMREALEGQTPFYEAECAMRDERGLLRYHVISGEPVFAQGSFVGFQGTTRDLTFQKRGEALVRLEHAVTRSLAGAATSRQVMQSVMKVICESEQWDSAGFFRVEDASGTTKLIAGWAGPGLGSAAAEYYKTTSGKVIPTGGMLSRVVASGKPLWVSNMTESQTSWAQRVASTKERATFFMPVSNDGSVSGVFAFSSREIREPDNRLLETLTVIAEQVGQFLRRKEAQQVLRESEARFRALTDLSSDWYWETGPDLRLTRVEGRAVNASDALPGTISIGKRFWEIGLEVDAAAEAAHRIRFQAKVPFRDVVMMQSLGGDARRYISISGEPILDQHGGFVGYRGVGRDISERMEAELRIQFMATHDGLTGLPNRVLFNELLGIAVRLCERSPHAMAVLFVDLDGFKQVNDTLGHDAGDDLLKETARRLAGALRHSDVVARLGGDEFVVILAQVDERDDVADIARKILEATAAPCTLRGRSVQVTASVGISLYGMDAHDEHALLRNADIAMYAVKQQGKNGFRFFTPERPSAP